MLCVQYIFLKQQPNGTICRYSWNSNPALNSRNWKLNRFCTTLKNIMANRVKISSGNANPKGRHVLRIFFFYVIRLIQPRAFFADTLWLGCWKEGRPLKSSAGSTVCTSCMDGIPFSSVCQSSLSSHEKVQLPKGRNGRRHCFAPAACHTIGLTLGLNVPQEFFNSLEPFP